MNMTIQEFRREYDIKAKVLKKFLLDELGSCPSYKAKIDDYVFQKAIKNFNLKKRYIIDENGKKRYVDLSPLETCVNKERVNIKLDVKKEPFNAEHYSREISVPIGGQQDYKIKSKRK